MSMFLPDGPNQTQPSSGVAGITPANSETTSADVALMQRVLSAASRSPNLIPADFMSYLLDWIQTQRLTIPVGQVFGIDRATQASRVHLAASQSLASGSEVRLNYDTVDFDYGGLWDSTNHQFVVKLAGKYVVVAGASFDANATGSRFIEIQVNSVTQQSMVVNAVTDAGSTTDLVVATIKDLVIGDAVRIGVKQLSGGSLSVLNNPSSNFSIARVAA